MLMIRKNIFARLFPDEDFRNERKEKRPAIDKNELERMVIAPSSKLK